MRARIAFGGETFPAGHWAYDIIEQLVVRGYLPKLYDVAKPYERMDVARAILETDKTLIEDRVTLWLFNKLEQELTDELDWLRDEAFPSGALRVGLRPELIGDKRDGNLPQFQFPEERGNTFGPRLRNRFRFTLHFGENITVYNNSILQSERVFALVPSRRFAGATGFTEQAFIAYHSKTIRAKFGRDYVQWGYGRNSLITNFTAGPIRPHRLSVRFSDLTLHLLFSAVGQIRYAHALFSRRWQHRALLCRHARRFESLCKQSAARHLSSHAPSRREATT
jgi:hypothetical protein